MITQTFLLCFSIALLFTAGEIAVRGAVGLASYMRLSPAIIGLTILGIGTSLPELSTSISATLQNKHSLLIGNIVGSNIANTLLILGLTTAISSSYVGDRLTKISIGISVLISLVFFAMIYDGDFSRIESIILLLGGTIFLIWSFKLVKDKEADDIDEDIVNKKPNSLVLSLVFIVVGLILLPLSADMLVKSSTLLAIYFGVSEIFIGLTIVSIGTSLPELAVSLVSIFRNHHGLSVGNIVGSNIFNIAIIATIAGIVNPMNFNFAEVLPHMVVMTIALTIPLLFVLFNKTMFKSVGIVFLFSYIGYISLLVIGSV